MTDHPITPPRELVQEWIAEIWHEGTPVQVAHSDLHIATRAAQWGANTDLKAFCELLDNLGGDGEMIRRYRRSKPQTLTSIALQMLDTIEHDAHYLPEITDTIRRALEDSNG